MDRDKLIRKLRRYARERGLAFSEDRKRGSGSHHLVAVGDRRTTIQQKLTPGRIEAILKQLGIDPRSL